MKQREQARIQVLNTVLEHHLTIGQAAEIMGVSERHTKRLLAAHRRDGPTAVALGNRGWRPHNAVPPECSERILFQHTFEIVKPEPKTKPKKATKP